MKNPNNNDVTFDSKISSADHQSEYSLSALDITPEVITVSFWVRSRNRVFGELINSECKKHALKSFFEIGCATGAFLKYLSINYQTLQVSGSDNMDEAVAIAQKTNPELDIYLLDAKQMDKKSNLESVGAFDILEHISEDTLVIDKVHLALRPGGLFFISVPQHQFMWSELDVRIKHKRRYSRKELTQKLSDAGFEIDYMTSLVSLLFPIMIFHRMIVNYLVKGPQSGDNQASKDDDVSKFVLFGQISNTVLDWAMRIDEWLIKKRVSLPFGGTLIAVARKPAHLIGQHPIS